MDNAFRVSRIQSIRNLDGQREKSLRFHRAPRDAVLQRHPIEKFHGNEGVPVLLADVINCADIGMVQRGCGLCLTAKTAQCLRVFGDLVGEKFERHKPI